MSAVFEKKIDPLEEETRDPLNVFLHDLSSPLLILNLALDELDELYRDKTTEEANKERILHLHKLLRSNSKKMNHLLIDFRDARREQEE